MTKILYAEDNELTRKTTLKLFERIFPDHEFEIFTCGDSLIERLKGNQDFQVVIADNTMPPGPSGSKIIRDYAHKLENVRFVLFYGGNSKIGENAKRNGAYDYVLKPCYFRDFSRSFRELLK